MPTKNEDNSTLSNGLTTDYYGTAHDEFFYFGADSAVRISFGSSA